MVMCFVPDCKHYSERGQCSFFRFPKNEKLLNDWLRNIRRKDKVPSINSRICQCHFKNGSKRYGPTIFDRNIDKIFCHPSIEEQNTKKRSKQKLDKSNRVKPSKRQHVISDDFLNDSSEQSYVPRPSDQVSNPSYTLYEERKILHSVIKFLDEFAFYDELDISGELYASKLRSVVSENQQKLAEDLCLQVLSEAQHANLDENFVLIKDIPLQQINMCKIRKKMAHDGQFEKLASHMEKSILLDGIEKRLFKCNKVDKFHSFGKFFASKMRKFSDIQCFYADKLISEIVLEAELCRLKPSSKLTKSNSSFSFDLNRKNGGNKRLNKHCSLPPNSETFGDTETDSNDSESSVDFDCKLLENSPKISNQHTSEPYVVLLSRGTNHYLTSQAEPNPSLDSKELAFCSSESSSSCEVDDNFIYTSVEDEVFKKSASSKLTLSASHHSTSNLEPADQIFSNTDNSLENKLVKESNIHYLTSHRIETENETAEQTFSHTANSLKNKLITEINIHCFTSHNLETENEAAEQTFTQASDNELSSPLMHHNVSLTTFIDSVEQFTNCKPSENTRCDTIENSEIGSLT